jgi:methyltransferase (TIGR00027 family)
VIRNGQPSQTALTAAAARAAHLIVDDEPPIFSDTLAYQLLGSQAEELIGYHRARGEHLVLSGARAAVTTRSRYTEDRLTESLRQETADRLAQYVILGAGLDSFAYRSELADQVRVFEVDHPATQQWKRQLLADPGIAMPDSATFVPVDFETDSLADLLIANGFDPSHPALVSWLGVTMYLTREAIGQTLAVIGGFAPGTEVIVDYMVPPGLRDEAGQAYVDLLGPVTAERGEPWLTFLGPDDMTVILEQRGFEVIEHVQQRDAIDPALWKRSDPLRASRLSLLTRASVRKPG